jgi:hypothetical protein
MEFVFVDQVSQVFQEALVGFSMATRRAATPARRNSRGRTQHQRA